MVFKKILVAIDHSRQSQAVFEQALELAQKEGSRLMVFHTLDWDATPEAGSYIGTLADVDMYGTIQRLHHERLQKAIEKTREWLQGYYQLAAEKGIIVEFNCKVGKPNSQICELAQSWGADLIVLGRRGYKGLSEMLLGSVSNYVFHHAPCSVLVVQGVGIPTAHAAVTVTA